MNKKLDAVIQGRYDFCTLASPLPTAFIQKREHDILYALGISYPGHNGVLAKDQNRIPKEEEIEEAIKIFTAKNLPFMYWSSAEILTTKGFQLAGVLSGIYLDLRENFPEKPHISPQVEVKPVLTHHDAQIFTKLAAASFGIQEKATQEWTQVNAFESPNVVHYLAYFEGVPAGTATLVMSKQVAGIWNLATSPDNRKRGIGTALVYTALLEAKKRDIPNAMAILMPKGLARGVFTKLGFEQCGEFPFYVYGFNEDLEK